MLAKTDAGRRQPHQILMLEAFFRPYENAEESDRTRTASLALLLMLLVSAFPLAAQTKTSRNSEVHDHLSKAEEYLRAKDPDSAAKEFDAVLALDPKNAEAFANLGVIAFSRNDYRNASQNFRKALAIDPSLTKTQALLGISQKRLGDPPARAMLEKSFSKLKDKQLRLQIGMELAALYDQQGDPGGTASVMRSLVDLEPDNVDVLFMAQRVYSELADDTLNKLAILAPGSARMQQVIAERLVEQSNTIERRYSSIRACPVCTSNWAKPSSVHPPSTLQRCRKRKKNSMPP